MIHAAFDAAADNHEATAATARLLRDAAADATRNGSADAAALRQAAGDFAVAEQLMLEAVRRLPRQRLALVAG